MAAADLMGLVVGVDGVDVESLFVGPPPAPARTAPALPALPELRRLARSRSTFSRDGVGEFR
jgi:hypothetical protein